MFGRFGKDAGSLLGVEIAPDSVRLLQLHRRSGRPTVAAWAQEPFEPLADGEWSRSPGPVVDALRRAYRRSGTRQRRVAVALPANQVICKKCRLPAGQADAEIEAQLLADADRLFPFPLEDLALDFQVTGASQDQTNAVDVMVAACRQSVLEPLDVLFEEAGLQLDTVEVDSIALCRAMPQEQRCGSALLRLEDHRATLHRWPRDGLPQRREWPLQSADLGCLDEGSVDAEALDRLLIASSSMTDPGRLQALSLQLNVPCRPWSPVTGLQQCDGAMVLVWGLALGGMR